MSSHKPRIVAVDIVRALAIVGMIAVHSLYSMDANGDPTTSYRIWAGNASAAFAVLAGVSISFIAGRKRLAGAESVGKVASLLMRAGIIGLIGLLLGYTNGTIAVVILPYYAMIFALAIPLAFLTTRALLVTGAILVVLMPLMSQLIRPHIVDGLEQQLDFAYLFMAPGEFVSDILFTGQFPALVWMFYICVGMVIGRSNLRSRKTIVCLLTAGAGLVVVAKTFSWLIIEGAGIGSYLHTTLPPGVAAELLTFGADGSVPTTSWWWLAVNAPHTGTTFDLLRGAGYTMFALGVVLLIESALRGRGRSVFDVVTFPLAAAGTMALTGYVSHIVFINSPLDQLSPTAAFWWQLVALGTLASVWSVLFARGPLEGLVTACTRFAERRTNSRFLTAENVSPRS